MLYIAEPQPKVYVVFRGSPERVKGYLIGPVEYAHTYNTITKTADLVTPRRVYVGDKVRAFTQMDEKRILA